MNQSLDTAKIARDYGITPSYNIGKAIEAGADAMHKADVEWLHARITKYKDGLFYIREEDWQTFVTACD